jgi:hypothetical protein
MCRSFALCLPRPTMRGHTCRQAFASHCGMHGKMRECEGSRPTLVAPTSQRSSSAAFRVRRQTALRLACEREGLGERHLRVLAPLAFVASEFTSCVTAGKRGTPILRLADAGSGSRL